MEKQRIEWIDTAKGICILLVVLHHVSRFLHVGYPFQDVFVSFRMPLYFILSGLFFKTYSGFSDFVVRKSNKLIIPYLFFFALGGVILPVLLSNFDIKVWSYKDYGFDAFKWVFSEKVISNPSIWFLLCLFEVNIIFYLIQMVSHKTKSSTKVCALISFTVGSIGLLLSLLHVNLPFFIDSALSATPFFFFGWYLRNYTHFLTMGTPKRNLMIDIPLCVAVFAFIHFFNFGNCAIHGNGYGGLSGVIQLYPYGILGTLVVLHISRLMGKVPYLSYIGRYSIIVLCTHAYCIQFSGYVLSNFIHERHLLLIATFILTVVINATIIPIFKQWLPYVTAQKDLFVIRSITEKKN